MCLHPKPDKCRLDEISSDPKNNLSNLISEDANPLVSMCSYYEPTQVSELNGDNYKLKILHLNIRSIPDKIDDLRSLLQKLKDVNCEIDFVLVCET